MLDGPFRDLATSIMCSINTMVENAATRVWATGAVPVAAGPPVSNCASCP